MVILHVKKGDESQFLYETTCQSKLSDLIPQLIEIYNGRLKIERLNYELEELSKHGISLPGNMQGLTEDQISDLKLHDSWADKCYPTGGVKESKDPMGKRNGQAPLEKMAELINRTRSEAMADISKNNVMAKTCLTQETIKNALDKLRGAVMIVYPMGLPPYDPIKQEFENNEDLSGTQVLDKDTGQLWWAGKELQRSNKLEDYIGKNEKTKIVAKLQKKGQGVPSREPVFTEEDKKQMMSYAYKKQEEMKKLEADDDVSYMNSSWADPHSLKRQFQGVRDVKWRP
ncbi:cilia- and flagella-associated protein 298-like isoform X2 [Xenia sp. Carnegie-2017]|uniref:cilia- and flagella-associated protein 298-like isoform X2 n=1 Tax=Xenia sp. Carnegie-2017 TaxID=2897299 RepID=UPI001F037658|nr:cilia- and flagella-associated protein 298-like isoform X2 [Xenia sp. Carnegie-2017]